MRSAERKFTRLQFLCICSTWTMLIRGECRGMSTLGPQVGRVSNLPRRYRFGFRRLVAYMSRRGWGRRQSWVVGS